MTDKDFLDVDVDLLVDTTLYCRDCGASVYLNNELVVYDNGTQCTTGHHSINVCSTLADGNCVLSSGSFDDMTTIQ